MKYVIKGDPIPLARPRMGRSIVYDSQKHEKLMWGIELSRQHNDIGLLEDSLSLVVNFYFKPAPSVGKAKRLTMQNQLHIQRPDIDNLIKWVLDVCNGIIYKDDAIVCKVIAAKYWDITNPRTEFTFVPCNLRESS